MGQPYRSQHFHDRITDGAKPLTRMGVKGETDVERHIITPPVETKTAALPCGGVERIGCDVGRHCLDQSKRVLSECCTRITTAPRPKLHVVATGTTHVIAPMVNLDVFVSPRQAY